MNNKLETMWKRNSWPNLRYYPKSDGETGQNHEEPVSGLLVSGLRVEQ
jgi:hypothetical protein